MKIRSSDLIHRSGWMPMWTARDSMALVRRSARVHIGDFTVYVTWHVLWCTQWALTTGMVVVTIGVKPSPVLRQFHYTDHFFLTGRGQRISTCVTTTETTNRISQYFCFQNHFNIGVSGNQIQICRDILQQGMQWVVLNFQSIFSWRFLNA